MSAANRENKDTRKDSHDRFLTKVTAYAEFALIAALVGIILVARVATSYLWLAEAVALSIFLVVAVLGVYWLFAEDE